MLFFKRRKNKDRRSHKERRIPNSAYYIGPEKRHYDRRKDKEGKHNSDRQKDLYRKMYAKRKTNLDKILDRLKDLSDEEKD